MTDRMLAVTVTLLWLAVALLAGFAVHEALRDDVVRYLGEHAVRGSFAGPSR